MDSFLEILKKRITCSICLDIYNDPKTLPCLHTFCYECLTNHARARHRQGKFPCPKCRARIDFPTGNCFNSFPTSFLHNNLLSDYEALLKRKQVLMLLDKAAEKEKENIMADIELTREKEKALKDVIRKFEETISDLETNVATAKRNVSQAAEQMIAKIREREQEAMTSLETTRVTRLEKINSVNKEAQSLLKQMNQAVEFAQNLVQRSSSSDIMQKKETLKQKFKELRYIAVPKHQESTFIKFTAASVEGLRLGDITTGEADARQYTPKGLDQTCQMKGKERELVVVGELDLKLFPGDNLEAPTGIAVNSKGNIAVTDQLGHFVYIFDKEGNCLRKIGSKGKNSGQFDTPKGVTYLNDNEIVIADTWNHRIQLVDVQTGTFVKSLGKLGAAKGQFYCPVDVCLDEQHRIVVTEFGNHRIQVITQEGETTSIFGTKGPEKLNCPNSCISYKNIFLVSNGNNNCVKVFDQKGTFLYKFGKQGNRDGQFDWPYGMLVDSNNNLLVCDNKNNRVQRFSLDGHFTGETITLLVSPVGIATASDGSILVTSGAAKKVFILK